MCRPDGSIDASLLSPLSRISASKFVQEGWCLLLRIKCIRCTNIDIHELPALRQETVILGQARFMYFLFWEKVRFLFLRNGVFFMRERLCFLCEKGRDSYLRKGVFLMWKRAYFLFEKGFVSYMRNVLFLMWERDRFLCENGCVSYLRKGVFLIWEKERFLFEKGCVSYVRKVVFLIWERERFLCESPCHTNFSITTPQFLIPKKPQQAEFLVTPFATWEVNNDWSWSWPWYQTGKKKKAPRWKKARQVPWYGTRLFAHRSSTSTQGNATNEL